MPRGPGKYDQACGDALVATKARCVVLAVLGGEHGNGFSVNAVSPEFEKMLPKLLRECASALKPDQVQESREMCLLAHGICCPRCGFSEVT